MKPIELNLNDYKISNKTDEILSAPNFHFFIYKANHIMLKNVKL